MWRARPQVSVLSAISQSIFSGVVGSAGDSVNLYVGRILDHFFTILAVSPLVSMSRNNILSQIQNITMIFSLFSPRV